MPHSDIKKIQIVGAVSFADLSNPNKKTSPLVYQVGSVADEEDTTLGPPWFVSRISRVTSRNDYLRVYIKTDHVDWPDDNEALFAVIPYAFCVIEYGVPTL